MEMKEKIDEIDISILPERMSQIPQPPKKLYIRGELPPNDYIYLSVVGSRNHTRYGKEACEKIISGLRGYPIVIVSGLAVGIDTIAHEAALNANLRTVAFPGSGLKDKVLHPPSSKKLVRRILESGNCLISEYEPNAKAETWFFPQRNRLMAGISSAILIIEAEEKSGTLITARMGTDYNRDVLAVPGQIFSANSIGTNRLIRQGATPITSSEDLLEALGFEPVKSETVRSEILESCSDEEKEVLGLLREPMTRDELIRTINRDASQIQTLLSMMEIKELIKEDFGELHSLI
jgi:DNA processing protein